MRLLLLTTGIFVHFNCIAQFDTTYPYIEDAIRSRKGVDKIVYLNYSLCYFVPFSHFVKNGFISSWPQDSCGKMRFRKKEAKSIDKAMRSVKPICWTANLFSNSIRINEDTLAFAFRNAKNHAYFHEYYGEKWFYISPPVFLTKRNLVIFRLAEMVGPSSGHSFLFIYEIQENKWERKVVAYEGAW